MVHGMAATQDSLGSLFGWSWSGPAARCLCPGPARADAEVAGIGQPPDAASLAWTPYLAWNDVDLTAER
ncbi:hypothetical protein SALBM311S_04542 [Streptomyces alboniger]